MIGYTNENRTSKSRMHELHVVFLVSWVSLTLIILATAYYIFNHVPDGITIKALCVSLYVAFAITVSYYRTMIRNND